MENISIGTFLKNGREAKNISLDEISKKTKININILKSLEAEDLSKLPNKTYVKGFVTNYARAVGLNVEDAKECLNSLYGISANQIDEEEIAESKSTDAETSAQQESIVSPEQLEELKDKASAAVSEIFTKKVLASIVILIALIAGYKGLSSFFSQLSNEEKVLSKVVEQTPETNTEEEVLKSEDTNLFEMKASKKFAEKASDKLETQPEKTETNIEEIKPEKAVVERETKTAEVKEDKEAVISVEKPKIPKGMLPYRRFYTAPAKIFTVLPNAPENNDTELLPENIKAAAIDGRENVYIVAKDGDTWISYSKDEDPIKKFVLKKGRRILIRGEKVLIFMGNMNVTKIFYNNQLILAQTKTGVKSLIFPPEKSTDFQLPLFPSYKGRSYKAEEYQKKMVSAPAQNN